MQQFFDTLSTEWWRNVEWMIHDIGHPRWNSFFWWLVALTAAVYALELLFPWRRQQRALREDFWLDLLYSAFNLVLFPGLGFLAAGAAVWSLVEAADGSGVLSTGLLPVGEWPVWVTLFALFLVRDFVHWNIHRLLHRVPLLWEFHKVHHSVRQMGVAAHLRYHWMENIVYKALEALPIALLGFSFDHFLGVAVFTLAIGHLNHANLAIPGFGAVLGPLRYVFNSPQMHIWHHAAELPGHPHGANFGLTLSVWDWLFGTVYWPRTGRDERLGFEGDEDFPRSFAGQLVWPVLAPSTEAAPATASRD